MSEQHSTQPGVQRGRIEWLDAARGIGIILVVYGHVLRGWMFAHLIPASPEVLLQDQLIYAFHMPLFFLLSGLVSGRSLARGSRAFLKSRLVAIVFPYFLWSILQGSASILGASEANNPASPTKLLRILWEPYGQFWFLYALFLCQLTLLLPRRWMLPVLVVAGVAFESFARTGTIVDNALAELPYFAAGYWLGAPRLDRGLRDVRQTALFGAACWALFALLFLHVRTVADPILLEKLALGFAGTFGTIALARLVFALPGLRELGAASMAIFLVHVIATAVVRAASKRIGLPVEMAMALGMILGLALPYAMLKITERLGIAWWFGFEPRGQRKAALAGGS